MDEDIKKKMQHLQKGIDDLKVKQNYKNEYLSKENNTKISKENLETNTANIKNSKNLDRKKYFSEVLGWTRGIFYLIYLGLVLSATFAYLLIIETDLKRFLLGSLLASGMIIAETKSNILRKMYFIIMPISLAGGIVMVFYLVFYAYQILRYVVGKFFGFI